MKLPSMIKESKLKHNEVADVKKLLLDLHVHVHHHYSFYIAHANTKTL